MNLWPHQKKAIALASEEFKRGHRSICIVMNTGAGKTRVGAEFLIRHLTKNPAGKGLFVAHREELIAQTYDSFTALGMECGVIQAKPSRPVNPHRPVQIASIQTLVAREIIPDVTIGILDEFHHFSSDKWNKLAQEYIQRRIPLIGLTATPVRADGRGFEWIDAMVVPVTMKELIAAGFLVPYKLVSPPQPLSPGQIAQGPLAAYKQHAEGRKTVVFAANIPAMHQYTAEFNAAGIPAAAVWGAMDGGARIETIQAYKEGRIRVLNNVSVLIEGFDDRETSCVIIARSVGSLGLYLQAAGRALRACPEKGKSDAVICDLFGNCKKDGFDEPAADRVWSKEGLVETKEKPEQAPERFCAVCQVLLEPGSGPVCECCGIARPEAVPPDIVNVPLVKYEATFKTTAEKRELFNRLKAIARKRGYSPWQPHSKYKGMFGSAPPREWW